MYLFREHNRTIRRTWAKSMLSINGIKPIMHGSLDTDAELYILNHQSLLDVVLFEYLFPQDVAWVAKKELGEIPLFGHMVKAPRMILIDRGNKRDLRKLLKGAGQALRQNRVIAIFPEGTRSDGSALGQFHVGAKIVAEKYNLKVQPIVIKGSRERLDIARKLVSKGEVQLYFLDTISPDPALDWYGDMHRKMGERVQQKHESRL